MALPTIEELAADVSLNLRVSYHGGERDFVVVGTLTAVPMLLELTYTSGDMELSYSDLIDAEVTTDDITDPEPL